MNIELLSPNYNLMAPDVSPVAKEVLLSLGLKFEMIKKNSSMDPDPLGCFWGV